MQQNMGCSALMFKKKACMNKNNSWSSFPPKKLFILNNEFCIDYVFYHVLYVFHIGDYILPGILPYDFKRW